MYKAQSRADTEMKKEKLKKTCRPKDNTIQQNNDTKFYGNHIESSALLLCKQISADSKSMKSTHINICQGNGRGVGYLKEKVDSWKEKGATNFVIDIIENGSVWIPREQHTHADRLSRQSDCDDWDVQDDIFTYLDHMWVPHNADRFAHDYNTKCKHFNSKYWCPGTPAIDAFTVDWKGTKLDRTVREAIRNSGIDADSYLYGLHPKMCELLINSRSDNTVKSYFNAFKRWERFISLYGHVALPAQPVHVALYLTYLVNNGSTYHLVYNAIYGIKWAHEINEASKRVAPKKTNKKDPVTTDVLIELCDNFKDCSDLLVSGDLCKLINKDKKLSYTAARECLLKRIRIIRPGCNIVFTRSDQGVATVASNADVSDKCFQHVSPVETFPTAKWEQMIGLMLTSPFLLVQKFLPEMKRKEWGRIINISSVHGLVASPYKAAYVSAKHGVHGLTKVVALETAETGITCNAICPGFVDTPIYQKQVESRSQTDGCSYDEASRRILELNHPTLQPIGTHQVAKFVEFLCYEAASQITGSCLTMDGGWTAR
ncbi:Hypothetical predicted protein [Mytilus galloprovincialis]|uniref:3-oxoacyl-[acyl-carrier-protein] reductase n=1 Tax=Mytilus galloprovincialis TaxID=29158 RepID=A0A8B6CUR7_MYTGA|nr:Hypothetical predicted protein [Mytilus galloprovincialis]